MKKDFALPDFRSMSDDEIIKWFSTLTTPLVLQHLALLSRAVIERFGPDAHISTSTFQPPRIVFLVDDAV